MTRLKRTGLVGLVLLLAIAAFDRGAPVFFPGAGGVVGAAEARVGRPLTPVSVAGVGRRTVRRCAVGVYDC